MISILILFSVDRFPKIGIVHKLEDNNMINLEGN